TILVCYALIRIVPPFIDWALINATWTAPNEQACAARGGACWAFITNWYRFILFGRYPYAEQWRPTVVVLLLIALLLASCERRLSGLPLALILAVGGLALSFPLGVALALGRRSHLRGIRGFSVAYIEFFRGLPFITVLFMAAHMVPLFLPEGITTALLWRIEVAFILFLAAYLAEAVRGGLQAIPRGQYEAASALGFGYWRQMRLVILPQALRIAIPPLVGTWCRPRAG